MPRLTTVSILALVVGSMLAEVPPARPAPAVAQNNSPGISAATVPSDAEVRERATKLIQNQHNDDAALEQYERTEHYVDRTSGTNAHVILDKTYRIVPHGGGTMKILLSDHGIPTDPQEYRRQLELLRGVLEMMANPNDSRAKAAREKYQKRQHERADFVDMTQAAFVVKWQGREACSGRPCDLFSLTPNPSFHPHSIYQDAMAHVTGKIYVDVETNQLARGEVEVTSDIYFGGGILGRLSRGGRVSMEQAEVAPGIWLPTLYQYDYSGRKFLFSFAQHQTIEASHYRRIGPPSEALTAIQKELASGKPTPGDP